MNALNSSGTTSYASMCAPVLFSLFLFLPYLISSQQVMAVQGGEETSEDINISWTIGESIIQTVIQDEITLTQGFHQPLISLERIKLDDQEEMFSANLFPNPTTGKLTLKMDIENPDFTIEVLDLQGKQMDYSFHNQNLLNLDLTDFSSGIYFFRIQDKTSNQAAVFKVEKL